MTDNAHNPIFTNKYGEPLKDNSVVFWRKFNTITEKEEQEIFWVQNVVTSTLASGLYLDSVDDRIATTFNMDICRPLPDDHVLNTTPLEWLRELMVGKDYTNLDVFNMTSLDEL